MLAAATRAIRPIAALAALAALLAPSPAGAQVAGLGGTLVVTNKGPATATIIDVASGKTVATLPTGQGPHEVVLSRDGAMAVITDYGARTGGSTLTVIDLPARRVVRTIDLGEYRRPHGIVFLPGDSLVAVTSETSRHVVVVHPASGAIRRAISTGHDGSHMVAVTADGARAYTGDMGSNTVSQIDLRTGTYLRAFDVPAQPEAINVTPDGREVWVGSNATGRVSVLDPATGAVKTAAEGFGWPYRILYTPDDRLVLLPDLRKEELRVVERGSHREVARLAFAGGAPQGITITPDGRYALQSLSGQGRVAIIDMATRTIVGHLAAGETPDGIAYTPRNAAPAR